MIGKGTFEIEIDGKKVGFKFGMRAAAITEKATGVMSSELFKRIIEQRGDTADSLLHYFYGGAVSYCMAHKIEPHPTIDEVGDWVDSIGFREAVDIFNKSIEGPKNPNQEASPIPEAQASQ